MAKVAKAKTLYICSECGGQAPKWQGQCPACGAWNTLVESVAETPSAHRFQALVGTRSSYVEHVVRTHPTREIQPC